MTRIILTCILILNVLSSSGCIFLAAGAAGVGTVVWLSDKATTQVDVPREKASEAVKEVFKNSGLLLTKETRAPEVTQFLGRYNDGREVWVDVRPMGATFTKIEVRVGWVNGEKDSAALLNQIIKTTKSLL